MRKRCFWLTLCPLLTVCPSLAARDVPRQALPFFGRTLDEWANLLDDANPVVRCRAATALGPFGKAAVPALLRALGDTEEAVQLSAIAALEYLGPDAAAAIPFLQKRMDRVHITVQCRCFACLGRIGPAAVPALSEIVQKGITGLHLTAKPLCAVGEAAVPALAALLQHPNPAVRQCVISSLADYPALAAVLPGLTGALHDRKGKLRSAALLTLARLDPSVPVPVAEMAKLLHDEECDEAAAEALGRLGQRAFPFLQQAVADKDPAVRTRAVAGLVEVGPKALPLLATALKDASPVVRGAAVSGVVRCGGARAAFPLLKEALKDKDALIRLSALRSLVRLRPVTRQTVLLVLAARGDPDMDVRCAIWPMLYQLGPAAVPGIPLFVHELQRKKGQDWWAAELLGVIGVADRAAVRALCAALKNWEAEGRRTAATALGRMGPACRQLRDATAGPAAMETEVVVPALLRTLRDTDAGTRVAAARALWLIGERRPQVLRTLTDVVAAPRGRISTSARREAIAALKALGPSAAPAVPVLIDALRDDDDLQYLAVSTLGAIGPAAKAAGPALVKMMQQKQHASIRHHLVEALARIGPAAVPLLRKALSEKEPEMWFWWVCKEAALLGPAGRDMLPDLIGALHAPNYALRRAAVQTIRRLGPECAAGILALSAATSDRDREVRQTACIALGELGPASRPAIPALAAALLDDSEEVRLAAATALQRVGPAVRMVLPALIDLLSARDCKLALAVAETVGSLGPAARAALPALQALLTGTDGELRVAAAVALWKITRRKEETVAVLRKALKDADSGTRFAAVLALRKIEPSQPVLPVLVALLAEKAVRERAAEVLEAMRPAARDVAPALRVLLEHRDGEVRRLALHLLEKPAPQPEEQAATARRGR